MHDRIISFIRALYGAKDEFIPLHAPFFSGKEKVYLNDCIDSTFVSSVGAYVNRFEGMARDYTGATDAVAVVNGTCGLTAALSIMGAGPDSLVITQALTFVATANAIRHTGARPVFLDSDAKSMGLCPEALVRFLDSSAESRSGSAVHRETGLRIAACVPMHVFGHACRIDELAEICQEWGIPLIEDAAEALGSTYKDKALGTWGQLGILSFNGNKTITTGGGGMILCRDQEMGKRVRYLVNTAKQTHPWEFYHDEVGWNYRMPNINAALGCAQMEQLDSILQRKRTIALKYKKFFEDTKDAVFMAEPEHCRSNYWLCSILLDDREQRDVFLTYSNDCGIMTRPAWNLMTELPMYANAVNDGLKVARSFADRLVNLPSGVL